ncbi:acyl-CoA thioesterase II [Patulibacter sp.]|uniref:acyl-CoA thioesterase n=1 Tax=Patulibacter sp. TaxID=1912859 RepID=UPI0027259506|nr:thioesterase family protein [Patulibacter sp.]MDO9408490.1 thioesterase family protein [Patulibacter sp.]
MSTDPGVGAAAAPSGTTFERATAVRPGGEGRWTADVDPGWEAPTGPNGGYLAALLVRALEAEVAPEGDRVVRSLTVHYLRTARTAPLDLEVRLVRAGRRTASATVTGRQEGREVLLGLAAFSARGLEAPATWTRTPPDAGPPPDAGVAEVPVDRYRRDAAAWIAPIPGTPPIVRQLRMSPRLGGLPFSGRLPADGRGVETGGWIGSPEDQPLDAAYLAQLTDFWWPPSFEAVDHPVMAPTIDLTIHLRADLPPGGLAAAPVLGVFRSTTAQGGLVEEDAELFHPDGTLLAQSRQLALLAPVPS